MACLLAVGVKATAQSPSCTELPLPWSETFDSHGSASMPLCWCASRNYDQGQAPHLDTVRYFSGGHSLYLYSGSLTGHYGMAISPEMALDSTSEVFVKFRYYAPSTATRLEVGMCDDTNRYTRHFVALDTLQVDRPNQWQEMVVTLRSDVAGHRLAFRLQRSLQVENTVCYIDDLHVGSCGTTVPTVSQLTATSVTVSWVSYGNGPIMLDYNGQRLNGVTSPLTLTGLQPATDYLIGVGCSDSLWQQVSVTTLDDVVLTPAYYEPFSGNGMPAGWQLPLSRTPAVSAGMLTLPPSADSTLVVLPPLSGAAVPEVRMALRMQGAPGTALVVGVVDYPLEAGTFTPVDTLSCSGSWQRETISLATYGGTGTLLALKALGTGTLNIDDLRVARCMIDNVRLYDLADSSVTVAWDTLTSPGNGVTIEWGPRGFAAGSGTVVTATANPFRLEGLMPATDYDLLVAPACGDQPCAYDRHGVTTFEQRLTLPYCTPFEDIGSGLPRGWVCGHGTAGGHGTAYQGSRSLRMAAGTVVTLPRIAADTLLVEFYGYGSGTLELGHMTTPYGTFVPTDTLTGSATWRRYVTPVAIPSGELLALRSSNTWNLDALAAHRDAIVTTTVSALRQTSAHVAWTLWHGDSVMLEYKAVTSATADFAEGSGTTLHALDSVTLTGLVPDQHYALHLRPMDDEGSCHWQTVHLQAAAADMAVPYCENFDALNGFPSSWRRHSDYGEYPLVSSERNHSPSKSMRFSATATAHTVALLPDFVSNSEHLALAFWTNVTLNPQGAMLLVGHLDDITDLNSFTASDTLLFSQTEVWQHHLVDLGDVHHGVALMLVGGGSGETRLFIDDLCVEPCVASNVRLLHLDSTAVTLAWDGVGVAALEVNLVGVQLSRTDTLYASPATLQGLTANAAYSIRVRSLCECGAHGGVRGSATTGNVASDTLMVISFNSHASTLRPPYCLDFENMSSGTFPSNCRRLNGTAVVSDRNYHNGSHSLLVSNGTTLVFPPLDDLSQLVATFYLFASNDAALADGTVLLGVMSDPDSLSSFTVIDTLHLTTAGEWQRLWSDLSGTLGNTHHVALHLEAPDTCTFFFDDLSLATCGFGTVALRGGDTLDWEALHAPSQVAIEYGPQGFTLGNGVQDTATAPPYVMQNLTTGASYDVYLRALCGTAWSCTPMRVSSSNAIVIPYCEYFESAPPMGLPAGWTMGRTYGGTPSIGLGRLKLKGHSSSTNRSIAVLPILADTGRMQVSFSLRNVNGTNGRLTLGHIAANADPNTFVPLDTVTGGEGGTWHRCAATLTLPAGRRLAIECYSIGQEAEIGLDSLALTRAVNPSATVVSARRLMMESDGDSYIEYGPAGFLQGEGTLLHLDTVHQPMDGLQPGQCYWFYTREDSLTMNCMPPFTVCMPAEAPLPYCLSDSTFSLFQLPELDIDSVSCLHLYLSLGGDATLVVGVMEADGDWTHFIPVDTLSSSVGMRQLHFSLASYDGSGRFVGLRTMGGNAHILSLAVTDSPLVTAEPYDDNTVMLRGNGKALYGPEGITAGTGTVVTVVDSLLLSPLSDTTFYDFYPLVGDSLLPCIPVARWHTSMAVTLPYCADLSAGLPAGWDLAVRDSSTVSVADSCLTLTATATPTVVKLPLLPEGTMVTDMEVLRSGNGVTLTFCGNTVNVAPGSWQPVRLQTSLQGRPLLTASGNGTVKVRRMAFNPCALPQDIMVGQPGGRTVELRWDTVAVASTFFFEYRLAGSTEGVAVRATTPPLTLQLLSDTVYQIEARCDSLLSSCQEPLTIRTLAEPLPLPYCTSFGAVLPDEWHTLTDSLGATLWVLPPLDVDSLRWLNLLLSARLTGGGQVTLGVMSDVGDASTFDSLTSFTFTDNGYQRQFHSLRYYYGSARFLALRLTGTLDVEHLSVGDCAAFDFRMEESERDHITIGWEQQGSPTVTVEYGPTGFLAGTGTLLTATSSPLRIDSLTALTNYTFLVSASCDSIPCRPPVTDTFMTFIPQGGTGCIDYTNLHAPYVSCQYGSYTNPSEHLGVVDMGYQSGASRHTVHHDTTERDARTGGLLRTVPIGKNASVRLGNWTTGSNGQAQAENITYGMTVDTTFFNLLVLRYAAVLQDPEHSASLQPRFRLQILNSSGDLIDSCGMADFIANPSLVGSAGGWHQAPNEVLWKDWTTVGIDLSAYSGQTIFIRLTTNDCGEGSHFGYAYFTLECATKSMLTEGCSYVPDNRFTVPSGFNYRWYTNHDTTTISDSSSIWVASDNTTTYFCQLSFIDNPACHFTMSAFAGARFPLAIIDSSLTVSDCAFHLTLTNRSTISGDGVTPVGTGESCETGLWTLPDGTSSTAPALTLHLPDTGLYQVTLVVGIANDQCLDTLQHEFHLLYPHPATTLDGPGERCDNDPADLFTLHHALISGWTDHQLTVSPGTDTLLTVIAVDTNGCLDTLTHTLVVHPTYHFDDVDTLCASSLTYLWRDSTLHFGFDDTAATAWRHRNSLYGCDSIMTLALRLLPSHDIHHRDTLCDNYPLAFFDTTLNTTGDYLHADTTTLGCDSLVTMHLTALPTYHLVEQLQVCDSVRWQDGHLYSADTVGALHALQSLDNCDSIIELHLNVYPSYHLADSDSVCVSTLSYPWRDTVLYYTLDDHAMGATLHRHSVHTCDSIMTLALTLMPVYDIHHHDTLCHDSQQPFFDTLLTTTGNYLHVDSTDFGCDSLVTMHLVIVPRVFRDDVHEVCDSMTWNDGRTYRADTFGVDDTLSTARGCDSVVTLQLTVHHSTLEVAVDTFCQGSQYLFRSHTLREGGYYADTLATIHGCDSVLAINLTRLDIPHISISSDYDCRTLHYQVVADCDVPYLYWSTYPFDLSFVGQEHNSTIDVCPSAPTLYILYADYAAVPHCPVTDTVRITPATAPQAQIKVTPQALEAPARDFEAYDIGKEYLERAWYINGVLQAETSRHLYARVPDDSDTADVMLVVGDGHCEDTASRLIPILYREIVAPNVFIPSDPDNSTFKFTGKGIIRAEIDIFNRRGCLVFHTDDFNEAWDGRDLRGNPCPMGNYVWSIRYVSTVRPDSYYKEVGSVLLIR